MAKAFFYTDSTPSPLHLASTPIAVLREFGLETYAGLSADDPANRRNKNVPMSVVLSAYGSSKLIGRAAIDELKPQHHRFISIDQELAKRGWENAKLCVVHRIPSPYMADGVVMERLPEGEQPDYDMYRTVVQYGVPGKGMGGVIYETPPNFNRVGRKLNFLSFSNKIYLNEQVDSRLVFLNYSISPDYAQTAQVKLDLYDSVGKVAADIRFDVPPFDFFSVRVNDLVASYDSPGFFSYTAASTTSALIPISVIVNKDNGGVSVEHSHPPQAYMMAGWPVISAIKNQAANFLCGR